MSSNKNGSLGRHCAVFGCVNTQRKLLLWRETPCGIHGGNSHKNCPCPRPFTFFKFPSLAKLRDIWITKIHREGYQIDDQSAICSAHFIDGKPTRAHYFPKLDIGMAPPVMENSSAATGMAEYRHFEQISDPSAVSDPFGLQITHLADDDDDTDEQNDETDENQDDNNCTYIESSTALDMKMEYREMLSGEESAEQFGNEQQESNELQSELGENSKHYIVPDGTLITSDLSEDGNVNDGDEDEIQEVYNSAIQKKPVPLASYDPKMQVLQISNPIQYIQECHRRIAHLLQEKEEQKVKYEGEINKLQTKNDRLNLMLQTAKMKRAAGPSSFGQVSKRRKSEVIYVREMQQ